MSSADYIRVVDTQLCKLRNMSRLYPIFTGFPNFCKIFVLFLVVVARVSCMLNGILRIILVLIITHERSLFLGQES